jgi:diguanylate cyclase (GGDEF)-like protein
MELKLYLRMLLRSWWIVALTALAALNVALLNAYLAPPQYSTQARFLITPSKLLSTADFIRVLGDQTFLQTFAEVWNGNTNFDRTAEALSSDLSDYSRTAVIAPSANVVELTVTGPNPDQAALIANTLGGFAMADINDKYGAVVSVSVLDAAYVPQRRFSPQPTRDAGLAVALGLVIGSVLAIGREQLRIPLEALRRRTTTDSESSAYNHAYFQRSIEDELNRHRAGQVSLGLVELSGLADLYENMPPLVRQRLMQYVTKTLQKELRGSDSVGRWTDTCFGVLLPATPAQPAARTLERIHRALTRPVDIDKGDRLDLAPYVGVAVVTGDQPAKTLIAQAEAALDDARRMGQSLRLYAERETAAPEPVALESPQPIAIAPPEPEATASETGVVEPEKGDASAVEAIAAESGEPPADSLPDVEPVKLNGVETDAEIAETPRPAAESDAPAANAPADVEPVKLDGAETDAEERRRQHRRKQPRDA